MSSKGSETKEPSGAHGTDRVDDPPAREAVESVFDEAVALFFRLRAVVERLHGQGEATSGRRAVMRELRRLGPRTVPQMARARPVSRQSMQSTVDQLARDGLVEFADNPAHKRSKLVRLTASGEALLQTMDAREAHALARLGVDVPEDDARTAAEVLASLRGALEDERTRALLTELQEDERRPEAT